LTEAIKKNVSEKEKAKEYKKLADTIDNSNE
jgi:hypothetical protein